MAHQRHKTTDRHWGAVLEVWEGFAADPEIRFKGSSGGLCTALCAFCLKEGLAGGVLHIGADGEIPWRNKTYLSINREDLVRRSGSRYAPASPCDGLEKIEKSPESSVFVGKPCDVAGLRMAQVLHPALAKKTALALGFFCAGTPSTRATLDLLRKHNIDPETIAELRYRGMGWPGMAMVRREGESEPGFKMTYGDSWGFLQKYRPFRCYLCPDLTAEFADISVGDPWYRETLEDEPGRSLILLRTEKGREVFCRALDAGYIEAEKVNSHIIYKSQKNLLNKRQAIWGRLLAMRLLGIPRPSLYGFHLFSNWSDLSSKEKIKSVAGTAKRIVQRKYFRPLDYSNPAD
jgi:coenzyme F420 hydrogenase subunit beta